MLRERILNGTILAGERLIEAELATVFGASRATIRSALQVLIAEGLVEIRQFRGAIARSLTRKDAEEIMTLRNVIDPLAARLAAESISPEKAHGLQKRLAALLRLTAEGRNRDRIAADLDIHRYIVECTGNSLLQQIYGHLDSQVRLLLLNAAGYTTSMDELSKQHTWLIQAICDGDGAAAEAAARHHSHEAQTVHSGRSPRRRVTSLSGTGADEPGLGLRRRKTGALVDSKPVRKPS